MGLFDDLDIESAADDPFKLEDGWHGGIVKEFGVQQTKDKTGKGLAIKYLLNQGPNKGQNYSEWKTIPNPEDPRNLTDKEKMQLSFIKQRLLSLDVPPDKMNTVSGDDVLETEVYLKLKTTKSDGKEYQNVVDMKVADGSIDFEDSSEGFSVE